ncbi:DNRLRE domain-containing protein [Bacillus sp. FJAT-47783]|uniref:DNRLRE domain-containing protein n=1 Tax=Bacillus sp. FJAT-47783 TaxID=2922712 RepID=UPI001FAE5F86|nr:DNRLRE domain-containing protein [Bacillus sp. FJAT-47783]
MEKIKCGSLDPEFLTNPQQILKNVRRLGLNTVNVPFQVDVPNTTSNTMIFNEERYEFSRRIVELLHENNIKVILEPFTYIRGGAIGETEWNPQDKYSWFQNWTDICERLINEIANPYNVWCFNVASNLRYIEYDFDTKTYPYTQQWTNLFTLIRKRFKGQVIYRTNYWHESQSRDLKKSNPLWNLVDFVAIDTWFELDNDPSPSVDDLVSDLISTEVYNRNQNVFQEIKDLAVATGKPIFFGGFGCPSLDYGPKFPWDVAVSSVYNEEVQANLYKAYQLVFSKESFFLGFSVWTINSDDSYKVIGKQAESIILAFFGNLTPEPPAPKQGDFQYDPSSNTIRYYNGIDYIDIATLQMVILQPDGTTGKDTMIVSKYQQARYKNNPSLKVGTVTDSNENAVFRTFLSFDLSSLTQGVQIFSAQLELYCYSNYTTNEIELYEVIENWSENINWAEAPHVKSKPTSTHLVDANTGWKSFDITTLVHRWVSNGVPNHGVMLKLANETIRDQAKYFRSSDYTTNPTQRPRLIIHYV